MSFTVEKLEHSMAKLTITVPAADFDKAMTAAYNKTKNRFNVPGFRKGKVPMAFIEKMYGPEVFYEDAANAMRLHLAITRESKLRRSTLK